MSDKNIVARLASHGKKFEILVNPDEAERFRTGKTTDVRSALISDGIFEDIRKAKRASEKDLNEVFNTKDAVAIAEQIIRKGEIPRTTDQKRELQEQKRKKIVSLIVRQCIDPRTKAPHTPDRVESAMAEAKAHVDPDRSAEEQVKEVMDAIRPLLPMSMETKKIALKVPIQYAGRARQIVVSSCKVLSEKWVGSYWIAEAEVSKGMEETLYSELNGVTHGELIAEVME